jgi:hypothetical protein
MNAASLRDAAAAHEPSVIVSYAGLPETDAIANALERPDEIERGNAVEDQEAMRRWVRMTRIVGARALVSQDVSPDVFGHATIAYFGQGRRCRRPACRCSRTTRRSRCA